MKNATSAWWLLFLGLTPSMALAQDRTPLPTITGATFAQSRDQYGSSPLCTSDEITLWSCSAKKREYALCSSQTATRTTGYLQYRASHAAKLTFAYPATKGPPAGLFTYNSYGNGNASIAFENQGYHYMIFDALRGASRIDVASVASPGKTTEIACGPNQTLQVNYTMRLMHEFGIWKDE